VIAANSADKSDVSASGAAESPGLTPVLERNIQTLCRRRAAEAAAASWQDRMADAVTRFTGSMPFVYLHLVFFGCWIIGNLGWIPGIRPWDETFVVLAMIASVEAIFLSTFVLITQNRMAGAADKRADLDLQISLLAEHEISKLAVLTSAIANHLGVKSNIEPDVADAKQEVAPDKVLDKIEAVTR
jgi:uncharacterized membrane protein